MKRIERLDLYHDRQSFDCACEPLNRFFQQTAKQHIEKGISRTFVFVDSDQPQTVIGFFTLSLCEIYSDKLPPKLAKKYPKKVPGVKLARLAVAKEWQRQGIGAILIIDAMQKAIVIADNAGVIGLFVDAKDEQAQLYYQRYGFVSFVDNQKEMFLPLATIRQILAP